MADFQLKTPVAFIIFNRPDTTARVFAEIARAKPPKLLVVGDGARPGRAGEAERVAAARAVIGRVDWDCEVLTHFSGENLGCKRRVSSGIDWVFAQVEEAIFLEDDCLPHPSFFRFCEELLARYRNEPRVSQINGVNFQAGHRSNEDSYYFSQYSHIWGWASWRDRWRDSYDVAMTHWPAIRDAGKVADLVGRSAEEKYWRRIFEQVYQGDIDTWDYQWTFACMRMRRLTALPHVNLISNVGFGAGATHTTGAGELAELPACAMAFPLRHPAAVARDAALDRRYFNRYCRTALHRRVLNKIRRLAAKASGR